MKKVVLLILSWYLFVNSSERSEWYLPVYSDGFVTIKVARPQYLEHKALFYYDMVKVNSICNCERCGIIMYNGGRFCHKCLISNVDDYLEWEYKYKYKRRNKKL